MKPTAEEKAQQHLDDGDIPIRIGDKVKWITRKQMVDKMRDDFQDRHVTTINEDDNE